MRGELTQRRWLALLTLSCAVEVPTRKHGILFVAQGDKDFLWTWARELQEEHGVKIDPDHLLSVLVSQLRALRAQGKLFRELSEIEARALTLARADWDESVRVIGLHAQEWRAMQEAADERKRREREQRVAEPEELEEAA